MKKHTRPWAGFSILPSSLEPLHSGAVLTTHPFVTPATPFAAYIRGPESGIVISSTAHTSPPWGWKRSKRIHRPSGDQTG